MSSGFVIDECWRMSDPVIAPLASLAAEMRALGGRVGVGELLNAHRALEAVDSPSPEDSRLALRAVLCSGRGDLERFELAYEAVFGAGRVVADPSALDELGGVERAVLPRAGMPGTARPDQG